MLERLIRSLPAVAWMAMIFALSSQRQFPQPPGLSTYLMSIAAHLVLFGVLALLLLLAISVGERPTRSTQVAAILGTVLYGVSDEFHQSFVPGRDASMFDLAVNSIGALIAIVAWSQARTALTAVNSR